MAETQKIERTYVIPLRNVWMKAPSYKRSRKSVNEIKSFIARHMKVPGHDTEKVKLDVYLNNEVWFRGAKKPPARIKVKAIKEGDIVRVELAEMPVGISFTKAKHERMHKKADKKQVVEKKEEVKTDEDKKEEQEKEKSVAIANEKAAEKAAKAEKHTVKKKEPQIHRMALKK